MDNPIRTSTILLLRVNKRIVLLLVTLFIFSFCFGRLKTTAVKGILDLRNYSWDKEGITDLNGEWAFYWNRLYRPADFDSVHPAPSSYAEVPGFWYNLAPNNSLFKPAFGYATYRLTVLCPPSEKPLSLKFMTVASSYKLFVNGKQIAEVGKVGTSEQTYTAAFQPTVFDIIPVNNKLDIVVQVANFTYNSGGLWDFIRLGTADKIDIYWAKCIATDFFIAGSFFLIGIFYLIIYFFFRRRKSPLYFAIFCLLIGIRPLVTGELGINYFTDFNWQFVKRIEFLALYLTVPVLSLFSAELFPREFSNKILRGILFISIPFIAASLFTTPYIFRYTLRPFQIFMLLTAFYGLYVYVLAVKNKRVGSIYFLLGFICIFIAIINDTLYNSLLIQSTNLLYAGLYFLILLQAITLSRKFLRAFSKNEKLNKQLEQINNELKLKNDTINETNEQLSKLNEELDSLVFRTSHDLRSPISSMYALADVIKMEEDSATRSEYLDFQKKTIMRLDALITDILNYAKNKSTALQYIPIDLKDCIEHALEDHIFSNNSEGIKRIVEVNQPCIFKTDRVRLNIIVNNIISNGLKHHNKAQENPYIKISAQVTVQQAELEITDNGPGIEPDHLDHIFTMFYRGNTSATGSGFGLYLVKEAVNKLGGTIKVTSEIDAGTSFYIVIPNAVSA